MEAEERPEEVAEAHEPEAVPVMGEEAPNEEAPNEEAKEEPEAEQEQEEEEEQAQEVPQEEVETAGGLVQSAPEGVEEGEEAGEEAEPGQGQEESGVEDAAEPADLISQPSSPMRTSCDSPSKIPLPTQPAST